MEKQSLKPHILCFDIDGTILNDKDGTISKETKVALRKAKENGHFTFINTGRSYAELDPGLMDIGFDGAICGCGTYIHYQGETILAKRIEGEAAQELLKKIKAYRIDALLEGEDYFYISKDTTNRKLIAVKDYFGPIVNKNFRFWEEEEPVFQKMSIMLNERSDIEGFISECEKDFDFILRSKGFYEVVPKGYSKGTGIAYMMEHLDVEKKHTMAIGDSTNDLAMLDYAHISIAMGNSQNEVKERVSFVTKTVEEEGVAYALKHFGFIG